MQKIIEKLHRVYYLTNRNLGCSTGRLITTMVNALGCDGIGVDINDSFICDANRLNESHRSKVTLVTCCILSLFKVINLIQKRCCFVRYYARSEVWWFLLFPL